MARKRPKPRRYSDEDRANALAALAANGGKVSLTASQLGIPRKSLASWAAGQRHPEAAQACHEKMPALADRFDAMAHKLLGIADEKAHELNARDAMVAAGIAVDKARLLRGEPTSIDERRDDARLAALRDRYAAAHAPGDPGAVAGREPVHPPPADDPPTPVPGT